MARTAFVRVLIPEVGDKVITDLFSAVLIKEVSPIEVEVAGETYDIEGFVNHFYYDYSEGVWYNSY